MPRAFLVVMDSVGCGGAPDAHEYFNDGQPDTGANTLGHIVEACAEGRAEEGRSGVIRLPNLDRIGLGAAIRLATGIETPGLDASPQGLWGVAEEVSRGKDTPSGHWEIAGVPVPWDWHYFPKEIPAFSEEIVRKVCDLAGTDGILGNCHASGVPIIEEHCAAHLETGWPICYTSVDSVFQIAAHEEAFGLERLLKLCADLAPHLHDMKVGRVIARPFVGKPGDFRRTTNRKDFAMEPPAPVLNEWVQAAGGQVTAIGKIGDIFSGKGIDVTLKGPDAVLMDHLVKAVRTAPDGSLTFANFVEFDTLYGHPRDVSGYARALEWFDGRLAKVIDNMRDGDLLVLTADHGNDPTWIGTDHTRELVPVLAWGKGQCDIATVGFSDIGASVADHLGLAERGAGGSFLRPT